MSNNKWYNDPVSRRFAVMCFLTGGFMLVELIFGITTNSLALVSDAFHMMSDVIAMVIGFLASRLMKRKKKNARFSYGFVRAEIIAGLVNSVFLVSICLFIMFEAITRFYRMPTIESSVNLMIVGGVGLGVNILGLLLFGGDGHGHSHGGGGHGHSHGGGGSKSHDGCGSGHASALTVASTNDAVTNTLNTNDNNNSNGNNGNGGCTIDDKNVTKNGDNNKCSHSHSHSHEEKEEEEEKKKHSHSHNHEDHGHSHNHGDHGHFHEEEEEEDDDEDEEEEEKHGHGHSHNHEDHGHSHSSNKSNVAVKKPTQNANIRAVYLHVLGDALGSVAVIGVGAFVTYSDLPGRNYADPAVSMFISLLIIRNALPIIRDTSYVLFQSVPPHINIKEITKQIMNINPTDISGVHEMHVWELFNGKLIASIHLILNASANFMPILTQIKLILHEHGIHVVTVQPEWHHSESSASNSCQLGCTETCEDDVCCDADNAEAANNDIENVVRKRNLWLPFMTNRSSVVPSDSLTAII